MSPKTKRIVSVSLGSSVRDHRAELELLGTRLLIERVGADGSFRRAVKLLKAYDGQVDVLSLGGVNLYLRAGQKRYTLRDGRRLAAAVRRTPVVDGFGLKDTWERMMIPYLTKNFDWPRPGQTALVCSALDRWGLAEALAAAGCRLIIGDAVFALGVAAAFSSLASFARIAGLVLPLFRHLPIGLLYPTGKRQQSIRPKFTELYRRADILAGDFHFLHRYLPPRLDGKTVITSTLTPVDREDLRCRGVRWLATSTPAINGRSFGANVWEAICVALLDKPLTEISPVMYPPLLEQAGVKPEVARLN